MEWQNNMNIKSDEKAAKVQSDVKKNDNSNIKLLKLIEKQNPKFANHVIQGNELMESFIKHEGGGIELLEQPVCENCEKVAAWGKDGAFCFSCKHTTKEPITVREYLEKALKGFDIDLLNSMSKL